jgi:Flp pilus assembly pilin Flp
MAWEDRPRPDSSLAEYGLLAAFLALWILIALDSMGALPKI